MSEITQKIVSVVQENKADPADTPDYKYRVEIETRYDNGEIKKAGLGYSTVAKCQEIIATLQSDIDIQNEIKTKIEAFKNA